MTHLARAESSAPGPRRNVGRTCPESSAESPIRCTPESGASSVRLPRVWRPRSYADAWLAVEESFEESEQLDFKRDRPQTEKGRKDFATDVASFAVGGGVIVIGIDEQDTHMASAITDVELKGAREQLQQIVDARVSPPLVIEVEAFENDARPGWGVIVVTVPPSPLVPHMVDHAYKARSGTTTRPLSEQEIGRLYEQRGALQLRSTERRRWDSYAKTLDIDPVGFSGVGSLRVQTLPFAGVRPHTSGHWLGSPLAAASLRARDTLSPLLRDQVSSHFLDEVLVSGWRQLGTEGWIAEGTHVEPRDIQAGRAIAAACAYTYSGGFSSHVARSLRDHSTGLKTYYAFEGFWCIELMAALLLARHFFDGVEGVSFLSVDVLVGGLAGARRTQSVDDYDISTFDEIGARWVQDNRYEESGVFATTELLQRPAEATRTLLDRLYASFLREGADPFEKVLATTGP
jgi:Putative DNA-binding domain